MKKQRPPLHTPAVKERLSGKTDALEILTQDHRSVQKLFREFQDVVENDDMNKDRKNEIVQDACEQLIIHSMIEEEIFYPAVTKAVGDQEIMDEAKVEHEGCDDLIQQLRGMEAGDELFDAKFIVLGEAMNHHIREEEEEMFPRVRAAALEAATLDLDRLGRRLEERKRELLLERGMNKGYDRDISLMSPHAKAVLTKEGLLP